MKADSNYFHVYMILIFNYNLDVGYEEEGESKLEDKDGDKDCLLLLIFQSHYLVYSVDQIVKCYRLFNKV